MTVKAIYTFGDNVLIITNRGKVLLSGNNTILRELDIGLIDIKKMILNRPCAFENESGEIKFVDMIEVIKEVDPSIDTSIFKCKKVDALVADVQYPQHSDSIWESVKSQGITRDEVDMKAVEYARSKNSEPEMIKHRRGWNPAENYQAISRAIRPTPSHNDIHMKQIAGRVVRYEYVTNKC